MVDRYQPYEPPPAGDDEPQWPLLPLEDERTRAEEVVPPVYPPSEPRRTAPPRGSTGNPVAAIVAGVAAIAIGVGAYTAAQPDEPDYRQEWEECLAEQQGSGGLLEPEDICSISYPDAEEEYGDLGYDNPEDEYDWDSE